VNARTATRIELRGDGIAVDLETTGARITRLCDLARGREWLEPPGRPASVYEDADMGGWDEMMPTIAPGRHPITGAHLSDHGELWDRPWRVDDLTATSVTTSIDGLTLDYCLTRTLALGAQSLCARYELTTTPGLAYLWAAHPLFAVRPGTRLSVPGTVAGEGGPSRDIVLSRDLAPGASRKYFVAPRDERAVATLVDPDGASIKLAWLVADAPYAGVWLDRTAYARHDVVGIEPTNGADDALDRALKRDGAAMPSGPRRWSVEVTLGDGGGP